MAFGVVWRCQNAFRASAVLGAALSNDAHKSQALPANTSSKGLMALSRSVVFASARSFLIGSANRGQRAEKTFGHASCAGSLCISAISDLSICFRSLIIVLYPNPESK